ncbi:unnamed protein product [Linum tenue]|uniref:Protein TIFY n=1 Tax=Linum tenue TaxID=586396 RepID=A0AAV0GQ77_9ROSI|nr:unnamed protein product [Linum tenue]
MELSISSQRLFREKSEIKREKVDDEDDDGDDRPCLQLFGERVVAMTKDYSNEETEVRRNRAASLRLREPSSVPTPAADAGDGDDDDDDPRRRCGGGMRMISSYHQGLTHFRLGGAAAAAGHQQRRSSLLESQMLPGMSATATASGERQFSSPAPKQLTMFYAGMVNVFDNIPAEKVEAIVLLARESCSSKARGVLPKLDTMKKMQAQVTPPRPKFAGGGCKLQADLQQLPVARKISLQHFMEKRRLRITSKSPYFASYTEQHQSGLRTSGTQDHEEEEEHRRSDDSIRSDEDRHKTSLSPFPARSGYFLSSANKR